MKLFKVIFFLFVYLQLMSLFGQSNINDSLQIELENSFGNKKLPVLFKLANYNLSESSKQVRKYALEALHLSEQYEDTSSMALSYSYLGASYVMNVSYDTAFNLFYKGLLMAKLVNDYYVEAKLYNNIATLYDLINDEKKAFENYKLAVSSINQGGFTDMYLPQLSLAKHYCQLNNFDSAKNIYQKVIKDAIQNRDAGAHTLGLLNMLESELVHQKSSSINISKVLDSINSLNNKTFSKQYQYRIKRLYIYFLYNSGFYHSAIDSIHVLLDNEIYSHHKSYDLLRLLSDSYAKLGQYKVALYYWKMQDSLQSFHLYEALNKMSSNQDAIYKLANQEVVISQIEKDRLHEKKEAKYRKIYINVGIMILLVLVIVIVYLLFYMKRNTKIILKKEDSTNTVLSNLASVSTNKTMDHSLYNYPSFQLNSNLIYVAGNQKFLKIVGKENIVELVGCNDFDLPWNNSAEILIESYQIVMEKLVSKTIDGGIFMKDAEVSILILPLLNQELFEGIHGFILPNEIINTFAIQHNHNEMNEIIKIENNQQYPIKTKVLAVDDQYDNLLLIRAYLKNTTLDLTTAQSGKEAIEKADKEKYDFILMDIKMPDMDGLETTSRIREKSKNSESKIFALTASTNDDSFLKSSDLFNDIVHKPISKKELYNKLSISLTV